jgi:hypothetical protein
LKFILDRDPVMHRDGTSDGSVEPTAAVNDDGMARCGTTIGPDTVSPSLVKYTAPVDESHPQPRTVRMTFGEELIRGTDGDITAMLPSDAIVPTSPDWVFHTILSALQRSGDTGLTAALNSPTTAALAVAIFTVT